MKRKLLPIGFLIAIMVCAFAFVGALHLGAAQNSTNVSGILFADNFQSGDLSAWDGASIDSPATCNVTNTDTFNGSSYTLHSYVPAHASYAPNSIAGDAFAYKDLSNYTNLYASCWVKWVSFGDSPTLSRVLKLAGTNGEYAVSAVGVEDINGTFEWALHYRDGDDVYHAAPNASTPLELNTWYYVEIHGQVNSTSGLSEGWINGEKFESATGLDNHLIGGISQLRAGLEEGGQLTSLPAENYINKVTVSTSYISYTPYSEPTLTPSPLKSQTPAPSPILLTKPVVSIVIVVVTIAVVGAVADIVVKRHARRRKSEFKHAKARQKPVPLSQSLSLLFLIAYKSTVSSLGCSSLRE